MDLDTEVAQAVTCCDGARFHAIEVVAAGNDAVAREAAVRCASESSVALEVAALCEAAAQEADANYRATATRAAQEARAAAARCDVEGGAPAATLAANACADSCAAACGDAAALAMAAREAAARCVLAREDLYTAARVALKTATWREWLTPVRYRCGEFADVHNEARKDAAAAALAARRATLRCVTASRHAVSAASIARTAASRCEAAGGDGVAAAAKAREAADRCVAVRAREATPPANEAEAGAVVAGAAASANPSNVVAQPDPVVPVVDAATLEARKAAARCDAALGNSTDKEFVDKMRGWLMTVATLFVSIAFQAITQPPPGMSFHQCGHPSKSGDANSPAPAPSLANSNGEDACLYLALNTVTMAIALTLLLALMMMPKKSSLHALLHIKALLGVLVFTVAGSYILGTSGNHTTRLTLLLYFALLSILVSATISIHDWVTNYSV